jgi:molybdopterin biosynthesis enzyme
MLLAALERAGFAVADLGIAGDAPGALEAVAHRAIGQGVDILLSSGGAAQGDADLVRRLAGARFLPVQVRPGRGIVQARLDLPGAGAVSWIGLPGNPVAAWVLLHLLVLPALRGMAGARASLPPALTVVLEDAANVRPGRIDLRRARITGTGEAARARLVPHQGSAMLRGLCEADVLVAIGPQGHLPAGSAVRAWPMTAYGGF